MNQKIFVNHKGPGEYIVIAKDIVFLSEIKLDAWPEYCKVK